MQMDDVLDCLIPRGGPSLIAAMREHARVPYVLDGDGNCHVFVDASADLAMAEAIVVNAKTSRPGVCNAAETLLVHERSRRSSCRSWPRRCPRSSCAPTTPRGGSSRRRTPATEDDYEREFLDLVMAVRVVASLDEAIAHVARYGTGHTEAIVTSDAANAEAWVRRGRRRRRAGQRVDPLHRRRRARASAARSASRPRSCTRAGRWGCAN